MRVLCEGKVEIRQDGKGSIERETNGLQDLRIHRSNRIVEVIWEGGRVRKLEDESESFSPQFLVSLDKEDRESFEIGKTCMSSWNYEVGSSKRQSRDTMREDDTRQLQTLGEYLLVTDIERYHHSIILFSICAILWESVLVLFLVFSVLLWVGSFFMSQSNLMGRSGGDPRPVVKVPLRRIKISAFDNSALVAGYSKTVIGRCMNPRMQDMKSLLFMFPRIWQLEGKVVGADLGLGKFQFDFDNEADILEVLKMEPVHFDHWMVSMVKWKPTVDPDYPSSIKFWIRV